MGKTSTTKKPAPFTMLLGSETRGVLEEIMLASHAASSLSATIRGIALRYRGLLRLQEEEEKNGGKLAVCREKEDGSFTKVTTFDVRF